MTAATLVGALALVWPLARRRLPAPWAAAAVAIVALNPFVLRFGAQIMSDVPYILALLAALAWADVLLRPAASGRRPARTLPLPLGEGRGEGHSVLSPQSSVLAWLGLGMLLALGAYMRSIGLAAAVGVLAWAWWTARGRRAGAASAAFVALMLPWWLRDAQLAGGWRYLEELFAAQYVDPSAGTVSSAGLVERALGNVAFVAGKPGIFGAAGLVVGFVAAAVIGLGFLRTLRRGGGAAEWATVPLVLAVLVWPIKTGRYLLPVVPLVSIYAIAGALLVAKWVADLSPGPLRVPAPAGDGKGNNRQTAWTRVVLGVCLALFAAAEALWAVREVAGNVRALAGGAAPAAYYRARPDWAHYLEAAAWLRHNGGPGDVAMARRPFPLYVYSGRYADKYRFDTSEEELAYLTAGAARKYVVQDAFAELRGDFEPLPAALRARGGDLVLRFETAEPAVRVWELVRPVSGQRSVVSGQ
jgi:hypothetical protein